MDNDQLATIRAIAALANEAIRKAKPVKPRHAPLQYRIGILCDEYGVYRWRFSIKTFYQGEPVDDDEGGTNYELGYFDSPQDALKECLELVEQHKTKANRERMASSL